jgi:hypothetical protein
VEDPTSIYNGYQGFVQRISGQRAAVLFEGGTWDKLVTIPLKTLDLPLSTATSMIQHFYKKLSHNMILSFLACPITSTSASQKLHMPMANIISI